MERQKSSFTQGHFTETYETYASKTAVRASGVVEAIACPEKYFCRYVARTTPDKDTAAKRFGRLMHMALLEGARIRSIIRVGPADAPRNTKAGKEKWAEFQATLTPENIVLKAEEADRIIGMTERILRDDYARNMFAGGVAEQSGYYIDPVTGLWCSYRPDYRVVHPDIVDIIDYKTTKDASYEGFQREIINRSYHIQAAHYVAGEEILSTRKVSFTWVAQEKDFPFTIGIYTAIPDLLALGVYARQRGLSAISACTSQGKWPGYTTGPVNMAPPKFALWQQLEDEEEELNG